MSAPSARVRPRLRRLRPLVALVSMVAGAGLVFALVIAMNRHGEPLVEETGKKQVAFQVERRPPKPEQKPRPKPRPRRSSPQRATPAPAPDLAGSLSGIDLGLPEAGALDLGAAAADRLTGAGDARDLVMSEGAFDEPPRPTSRTPPRYPPRARAKGVTGRVKLQLLVDERGRVKRVRVLEATPEGVFEQSAVEAVKQWRFRPGVYGGRPQAGKVTQVLRFTLS